MNKFTSLFTVIVIFTASLAISSCGKTSDPNADKKLEDIKQQQQQQNNQQQNNQTQQTQSSVKTSYAVTEVDKQVKSDQLVDFKWNQDGKEQKLSDYKGKVILLNFWATWCPPCRKELPDLSQISNDLKGKDFVMIGVSVDDNQQVLDSFLKTNNLSYTNVFEPNELVGKYMEAAGENQNVVPQTYIIDKKGKVVEAIMGSRSKQAFLELINKYLNS